MDLHGLSRVNPRIEGSLEVKLPTTYRWKSRGGKRQRRGEKKREEERRREKIREEQESAERRCRRGKR
jgi:hypothetical protein